MSIGVPSRTSPLTVALELLALTGIASALGLALLAGVNPQDLAEVSLGLVVVLARLTGWWFRTYTVTAGELVLDEGILQKRHRVVPFSRIQQVELRQQLMQRALGIATVHIETAGDAGGTAVTLRSLELRGAEALRDHLLAEQRRLRSGRSTPGAPTDTEVARPLTPATPLVRLGSSELLVAGATSSGTVLAAMAVLVGAAALAAQVASGLALGAIGGSAVTAALFVAFGAAGTMSVAAIGALSTLVSSWGFELALSDDDLHVTRGLLDKRQHTMPRHRLQHARLIDNPPRRALGVISVRLHSAARPGGSDEQQGFVDIPLLRRSVAPDLLEAAMGTAQFRPPPLAARPPAARRRAVLRRSALTVAVAVAVAALWWPVGAGVLPFAVVGVPWGRSAHRRAGSSLDGPVVSVASGAVVHHVELIPAARLQSARTSASPLQRRVGLASLHLDVAGGGGSLRFGSPGLADLSSEVAAAARRQLVAPR